jgi:N-glycosylase/DNA lyase
LIQHIRVREKVPVNIENIKSNHRRRRKEIRAKLREFRDVWRTGSDERLWEEMVYCFFTGGCSAKMGLRSIEAVRHILLEGDFTELSSALSGVHRFPFARSRYIVASRDFLSSSGIKMRLRQHLTSLKDPIDRRDWLVKEKRIKGLGYKEASHYLRNIGLSGYGILDKHILNCLVELGIIADPKPPSTRTRYLETEEKLRDFAIRVEIDFDELDLVLWSMKTGEILK